MARFISSMTIFPVIALGSGAMLTLMILLNGTLAAHGTLLFASWVPHATGTVMAAALLAVMRTHRIIAAPAPAPAWAYLGGVSGAITVVLTSYSVNTALALSGTIALGLAGQMIFSLIADARGLFGLQRRMPGLRDLVALALILAGSVVLIFFGRIS
jgi:transporter family-2 protein